MSDMNEVQNGAQELPTPQVNPEREKLRQQVIASNPDWGKSEEQATNEQSEVTGVKEEKPKSEVAPADGVAEKQKKNGYDHRISKLTSKLRRAEAELERFKSNKPVVNTKPVDRNEFNSDAEYIRALAAETARTAAAENQYDFALKQREALLEQERDAVALQEWQEKEETVFKDETARKQYKALLDEHVNTELPNDVWDVIRESEVSPMLLAVVLSNEGFRERIATMTPARRNYELLKLEDRVIANMAKQGAQKQTPKVSQAPTPVGSVTTQGTSKSDSELSWAEIIEKRKQERAKQGR